MADPKEQPQDFAGKVALVTGSARGIGRAAAELFGRQGARVVVSDILDDEGAETTAKLRDASIAAEYISCDTSRKAGAESDRSDNRSLWSP